APCPAKSNAAFFIRLILVKGLARASRFPGRARVSRVWFRPHAEMNFFAIWGSSAKFATARHRRQRARRARSPEFGLARCCPLASINVIVDPFELAQEQVYGIHGSRD